jgi:hypothetical protein
MGWDRPTPYSLQSGLNTSRNIEHHSFSDETQFHQSLEYSQSLFQRLPEFVYIQLLLEMSVSQMCLEFGKNAYAPHLYVYDLDLQRFDNQPSQQSEVLRQLHQAL